MHDDLDPSTSLQTVSDHAILEAIAGIDQKLANIQRKATGVPCESCRQKKVKCSRSSMWRDGRAKRVRQRRSFSGPFRTLLPVVEETVDECPQDTEVEALAIT